MDYPLIIERRPEVYRTIVGTYDVRVPLWEENATTGLMDRVGALAWGEFAWTREQADAAAAMIRKPHFFHEVDDSGYPHDTPPLYWLNLSAFEIIRRAGDDALRGAIRRARLQHAAQHVQSLMFTY
jgi:hypothetical protein